MGGCGEMPGGAVSCLATLGGCRRLRVIRVMSVLLVSWCRCCVGRVRRAVAGSEGRTSSGSVLMRLRSWAGSL